MTAQGSRNRTEGPSGQGRPLRRRRILKLIPEGWRGAGHTQEEGPGRGRAKLDGPKVSQVQGARSSRRPQERKVGGVSQRPVTAWTVS